MKKIALINSFTPEIGYYKFNEIINTMNEIIEVLEAKNGKEKADTGKATGAGKGKGK